LARAAVVLLNKERRKTDGEKKKNFDYYTYTRRGRKIIQRQREKKQESKNGILFSKEATIGYIIFKQLFLLRSKNNVGACCNQNLQGCMEWSSVG